MVACHTARVTNTKRALGQTCPLDTRGNATPLARWPSSWHAIHAFDARRRQSKQDGKLSSRGNFTGRSFLPTESNGSQLGYDAGSNSIQRYASKLLTSRYLGERRALLVQEPVPSPPNRSLRGNP